MAGTFTPTGSYSNLTRLELEQLRKADFYAGLKGLTIGDSALPPEGVVGKGDINAEPFYTGPSVLIDDVFGVTPPNHPGEVIVDVSQVYPTQSATVQWFGPTFILDDTSGGQLVAPNQLVDLTQNFPGNGVLPGDILLIRKSPGSNTYAVGVINTVNVNDVVCSVVNNTFAGGGSAFVNEAGGIAYTIIRANATQLFAVPGSGPTGEEQTFLTVIPGSGLHSATNPSLNAINADRIRNVVPASYGADTTVDRADAVFASPAPFSTLDLEGYRVILYPDNGSGTAPDLTRPIASLNPVIDPGIPAADQRFTIDYKAGIIRFSCAPKLGGDIKVAGGVNPASGRLSLYAVFWAVDLSLTKGAAKLLYQRRSTPAHASNVDGKIAWQEPGTTGSAGQDWVSTHPIEAGSLLSSGNADDATFPRFIGIIPNGLGQYIPLLMSQQLGGAEGACSLYTIAGNPALALNATYDNASNLWFRVSAGPAALLRIFDLTGNKRFRVNIENTGIASWTDTGWQQTSSHGDPIDINLDVQHQPLNESQLLGNLNLGQGLADYSAVGLANARVAELIPRLRLISRPSLVTFAQVAEYKIDGTSAPVRVYTSTDGACIIFTTNAFWDPVGSQWHRDTAATQAFRVQITSNSTRYDNGGFGSAGIAFGWVDATSIASWNDVQFISSGGNSVALTAPSVGTAGHGPILRMGAPGYDAISGIELEGQTGTALGPYLKINRSNPTILATPQTNTLYSKNIIKAYGLLRNQPATSTTTWVVDAGFGFSLAGYDGGGGAYYAQFSNAFNGSERYIILDGGMALNQSSTSPYTISYPSNYFGWDTSSGHSAWAVGCAIVGMQNSYFDFYPIGSNGGGIVGEGFTGAIFEFGSTPAIQVAVLGTQN